VAESFLEEDDVFWKVLSDSEEIVIFEPVGEELGVLCDL
jgi:hypothetical protein